MQTSAITYAKRFTGALSVYMIHTIIASVLYFLLLCLAKMMWTLFSETPVGRHHNEMFPDRADMLSTIFFSCFYDTAFQVMAACLISGFAITATGRFIHLYRIFYRSFDLITRTLLWGVPVAFAGAHFLYSSNIINSMGFAFAFTLFPALAYTRITLRFNYIAVPEVGSIVGLLRKRLLP